MRTRRLLFCMAALLPLQALAELPTTCPELPATTGLAWETVAGDDFLFCKAVREDGFQAFSVMLRADSPFRERMSLREEAGRIDGHKVRWYRGQLPNEEAIVRETLIELGKDLKAHIMLRVEDEAQLADSLRLAEQMRFNDSRIGSN
ncbi:hypothetical protein [Luteimonas sp. J29]|jgi:hypothetical protein|uniref:hypothetical protein n=1 Tax=Luteimonas sp. J29 TaxID=935863 RepID=UPI0012EB1876|nr:hypothetical protein [Luteimonas sp. J29]